MEFFITNYEQSAHQSILLRDTDHAATDCPPSPCLSIVESNATTCSTTQADMAVPITPKTMTSSTSPIPSYASSPVASPSTPGAPYSISSRSATADSVSTNSVTSEPATSEPISSHPVPANAVPSSPVTTVPTSSSSASAITITSRLARV